MQKEGTINARGKSYWDSLVCCEHVASMTLHVWITENKLLCYHKCELHFQWFSCLNGKPIQITICRKIRPAKKKKGLNSKWSSPWLALTYSLAHSSCGVHLVAIVTLTFVSSFKIYTYLTAYTRVEAFIDICGEIFIVLILLKNIQQRSIFRTKDNQY